MFSDCCGRLQHKGSFGFVQNAEKIVPSRMFFLTKTSNAENKATVYLSTCLQELAHGHHLIFIHGTLPFNLRLKLSMCDSQVIRLTPPPLPSLLSILKDFPVPQYAQAACDVHGGHFYHSMRVLFSWTQLGSSMKSTCAEPHMSLVLMTDVISEGSGEHVCLHNLVRVSPTNKV